MAVKTGFVRVMTGPRLAGLLGCCTEGHGKSMRSSAKNPSSQEPHSLSCGIGVGLDPTLIAERK